MAHDAHGALVEWKPGQRVARWLHNTEEMGAQGTVLLALPPELASIPPFSNVTNAQVLVQWMEDSRASWVTFASLIQV